MINGSWDRRLYGVPTFGYSRETHPWVSTDPVSGQLGERPVPNLSKLRLVTEGGETIVSPSDPSPCSPISNLQFASRDETMTLTTTTALGSRSQNSVLFSTTDSSFPGIRDQVSPSEQLFLATQSTPVLPQQPTWDMSGPDGPAVADHKRAGRRPLPEVPSYTQSRPLPPRPTKMATVPGWRGLDRFAYPPHEEFVRGCSKDRLVASRPVSDSGSDALTEERPNHKPTPEDNHARIVSAPVGTILPFVVSPSTSPIVPLRPAMPAFPPVVISPPTSIDLVTAASLTIVGENGEKILFGSLFRDRKVVVVFICHFWCLCCQNYARSVLNSVTPEILEHKGVDLVVVGNGTYGAIKTYKSAPRSAFWSEEADLTEF